MMPVSEALQQYFHLIKNDTLYKQHLVNLNHTLSVASNQVYQDTREKFNFIGEISLVVCGSAAHGNLSLSSDLDYFIIISNEHDEVYISQVHELVKTSLIFLPCENILTHTGINKNYILYHQIDELFLDDEIFRNSLTSGLLYCSEKFRKRLERKRNLLKDQVSERSIHELFPYYSKNIQNHWDLADSDGRIYLPGLVWKVRMIYHLYDLKKSGEEQLHTDFSEIIHIKTLLYKFRDYMYLSHNKKPYMILVKSLGEYGRILGVKELSEKLSEYNDYLNHILIDNGFVFRSHVQRECHFYSLSARIAL